MEKVKYLQSIQNLQRKNNPNLLILHFINRYFNTFVHKQKN